MCPARVERGGVVPRPVTYRAQQRDATRARLIEIVMETLEAGGEQAVRIRGVADALGASVGAVYHHFPSREDIIVAARIQQFAGAVADDLEAIRRIIEHSTTTAELRAGMLAVSRVAHGPARSQYRQLRAEVIGAARHNEQLRDALATEQAARTAEFAELLALAQAKGQLDPAVDPTSVAVFFQGVALGLSLSDIVVSEPLDEDAWAQLMARVLDALLVNAD